MDQAGKTSSRRRLTAFTVPEGDNEADIFSSYVDVRFGGVPHVERGAVIAAPVLPGDSSCRPTVFAVSGEQQRHVSKFFRSWRAERRGWQVVVPFRSVGNNPPLLFEGEGLKDMARLAAGIAIGGVDLLPAGVENGKLHLVGTSNGGASVLALACALPHIVASLTMVTGFIPEDVRKPTRLERLRTIPCIRLYAGSEDELRHNDALTELHELLKSVGVRSTLRILPVAGHMTIGNHIDQKEFWAELEGLRSWQVVRERFTSV